MFSHDTHQMPDEFILDYFPSAKIPDFLGYRDLEEIRFAARAAPASQTTQCQALPDRLKMCFLNSPTVSVSRLAPLFVLPYDFVPILLIARY